MQHLLIQWVVGVDIFQSYVNIHIYFICSEMQVKYSKNIFSELFPWMVYNT